MVHVYRVSCWLCRSPTSKYTLTKSSVVHPVVATRFVASALHRGGVSGPFYFFSAAASVGLLAMAVLPTEPRRTAMR